MLNWLSSNLDSLFLAHATFLLATSVAFAILMRLQWRAAPWKWLLAFSAFWALRQLLLFANLDSDWQSVLEPACTLATAMAGVSLLFFALCWWRHHRTERRTPHVNAFFLMFALYLLVQFAGPWESLTPRTPNQERQELALIVLAQCLALALLNLTTGALVGRGSQDAHLERALPLRTALALHASTLSVLCFSVLFMGILERTALRSERATTRHSLETFRHFLQTHTERVDEESHLLVAGSDLREILRSLQDGASAKLTRLCSPLSDTTCFILDAKGLLVATSNQRDSERRTGKSPSDMPYFEPALRTGHGTAFLKEDFTENRGYYSAHRVDLDGGSWVFVLKKDLLDIPSILTEGQAVAAFLVDSKNEVFLSSLKGFTGRKFNPDPQGPSILAEKPRDGRALFMEVTHRLTLHPTHLTEFHIAVLTKDGVTPNRLFGGLLGALGVFLTLLAAHARALVGISTAETFAAMEANDTIRAQLFHSSKLASIGLLAAGVAHEVKNPLAILLGYVRMARKRTESMPPENAASLEDLFRKQEHAAERILGVIQGLNTFARMDSGTVADEDLHLAITESVDLVRGIYSSQGIEIELSLAPSALTVRGCRDKLRQVMLNFLTNARDALQGASEPRIRVHTRVDGPRCHLDVSDNGCGIPHTARDRIFDPFFTTKAPGKGTGLGLALTHAIVNEMGGTISVVSREGEGTTFSVTLPLVQNG